jgi:2-amino-4-hydroxy-6-hydroxymethyldihydropteridine diphosphokinase
MKCYIGFGANLGDRERTFAIARASIAALIGEVIAVSRLRETEALLLPGDPTAQPRYLNAVIAVSTDLEPRAVLEQLLQIERELGRVRERRWAPRTIDLDVIACDGEIIDEEGLSIPHPEMQRRLFVLEPLAEIAPGWRHPLLGKTAAELLDELRLNAKAASSPALHG